MKLLVKEKNLVANDENMMDEMWHNMVKDCMEGIVEAKRTAGNRLLLINYDDFVNDPTSKLVEIEKFLNLPHYDYDCNNIESLTNDDDLSAWGLNGMHTIRKRLSKTSIDPKIVLGERLFNKYSEIEKYYI